MAIRFTDVGAIRAQLIAALAGVNSSLLGTHTGPAGRSGVIGSQLAGVSGSLIGLFAPSAARSGLLLSQLDGVLPSLIGTSTPPSTGSGLTADPYSGYAQTFWADALNGNDANPGTSKLSAKKTFPAGMALLQTPQSRLMVVPSGVYTVSTTLGFPAGGTSDSARMVVQGDPSAGTTLPQIVFAPNAGLYINQNGARPYVTLRKLDISSSSSASSPTSISLVVFLSDTPCIGFQAQFNRLHDAHGSDITCGIRMEGSLSTGVEISNNYFYNFATADGASSDNAAGILTYQVPSAQIHHNDLTRSPCLIYIKRCPPSTANNGWNVYKNFLHDYTNDGIYMAQQGAGDLDGFFDTFITDNFFSNGVQGIRQSNIQNTLQSSRITVARNTFANMQNAISFAAMTGIDINSNVLMATTQLLELVFASPFVNRIARCNNNAILTSTGQSWNMDEFDHTGTTPVPKKYTSLPTWQKGFSVDARPELAADPDVNSVGFTTASIATNFPNLASGDPTLALTSVLKGIGLGGIDPGCNKADLGTGW